MNKEEIEDALFCLEVDRLNNKQIKLLLNYIDKLQKELKDSINARFELQRRIDKQEKIIDSLAQWVSNLSPMVDKQAVKDIIYKENKDE